MNIYVYFLSVFLLAVVVSAVLPPTSAAPLEAELVQHTVAVAAVS